MRNVSRETRPVSREMRQEVVTYFWVVLYNCDSQWFGYQSMFICTHSCSKSWLISHLITDFYNFIPVSVYSLEIVLIGNICQTLYTAYLSIEIHPNLLLFCSECSILCLFNPPLNVWQCDKAASLLFDMLLQKS